ncbi:Fic family protein [Trueperella bialowiezensis]|uniref:Uncharacterized protein conserved in archaea n=1 Tax=Trueperella bialowiezensis TaxID=312285 RepID=A0A3S4V6U3_9ACTO|nr:Fic family protein [Trueperella bialowiezensis]VEI13282.1 Uncharacterized protein conserved in archaea [Trueperella bialowiezensis]
MSWPLVSYEEQTWQGPTSWIPRSQELARSRARYTSAIPAEIAQATPAIDDNLAQLLESATLELSRFDAEHGHHLHGFGPLLLRSEASSSSRIENLTASARNVLAAELDLATSRNSRVIVGNTRAMEAALELAGKPDAHAILAMHSALLPDESTGTWRQDMVWIGTSSLSPVGADYVAPTPERVPGLIADLELFMERSDIPALTLAALAHAQFETIHPFTDGNGRTGRALVQALLRHRGVTRSVAIPVSAGLLANLDHYHSALDSYREGDIAPILEAFAHASLRAVENSRRLVSELQAVHSDWEHRLVTAKIRRDARAWDLIDALLTFPVATAGLLAEQIGISPTNIYPHMKRLESLGIVEKKNAYKKGSYWIAPAPLAALDALAERAGRRE